MLDAGENVGRMMGENGKKNVLRRHKLAGAILVVVEDRGVCERLGGMNASPSFVESGQFGGGKVGSRLGCWLSQKAELSSQVVAHLEITVTVPRNRFRDLARALDASSSVWRRRVANCFRRVPLPRPLTVDRGLFLRNLLPSSPYLLMCDC